MQSAEHKQNGILYIIATPIGNLEDITFRAIKKLKDVDCILCEDKRVTQKLLTKYEINTKLISFHKYNEEEESKKTLSYLKSGKNIALVSDAGSPLISDPGIEIVSLAYENNIKVITIPGASALTSALSICPIKFHKFTFLGFLPEKRSKRESIISSLKNNNSAVVLYIAPHDFKKYLKEIYDQYPEIDIFYARELTKIYEESWLGKIQTLINLLEKKELKGEIVLVLDFQRIQSEQTNKSNGELISEIKKYLKTGLSLKESTKIIAKEYNLSSKNLYEMYIKNK